MKATVIINSRHHLFQIFTDDGEEFVLTDDGWANRLDHSMVDDEQEEDLFALLGIAVGPNWRNFAGVVSVDVDLMTHETHTTYLSTIDQPDNIVSLDNYRAGRFA